MSEKYIQNKKIIQSKIGEEVVMMDMDSGFYFGLNSVASAIWTKLENEITLDALVEEMLKEYAVEKTVCERDINELLEELLEKKIIRIVT
jgi:hypothetical protein